MGLDAISGGGKKENNEGSTSLYIDRDEFGSLI
jgi:hypothetical protein